jgi:carboxypeptidase Q
MTLMKKTTLFLVCCAAVLRVAAQQPSPTPQLYSAKTLAELEKIQKAALESNYAYRRLAHLTNNIGPRLTGSPQAQKAVEYVAEEMRKAGLTVTLQKLTVPHWVRGVETGEIVQWDGMAPGTTQKIVLAALGGSIATPAQGLTAEVVVVNDFDELAAMGQSKIAGKIVLFNNKFDVRLQDSGFGGAAYGQAVQYRFNGAAQAAKYGAVAALVRSAGASQNRLVHTGMMAYDANGTKIPTAAVSYEDAELIASLTAAGKVRAHITLTPQTLPDTTSYNVIGDLKGSERPDEVVVVGGHLDSWDLGTGAIDDGAGVVVSMQAGFLVKFLKLKPKRTIRIVAFMNEENGGVGGREYGASVKDEMTKQFAAIESDLGASHPLGFYFSGKREALPFFAPISKTLLDQGAAQVQYQFGGVGSDIGPLTQAGVPSFAPWFDQRTYFLYHHTAADTLDKVDPKQLAEVGSVVAVLAYALANLEQPLPR